MAKKHLTSEQKTLLAALEDEELNNRVPKFEFNTEEQKAALAIDESYNSKAKFRGHPEFPKEHVSTYELLMAYFDCRKHKAKTHNAIVFEMSLMDNISALYHELNTGTYVIGRSICFLVYEPKPREIFAAHFRDRVVHHLGINRFLWLLETFLWIQDSYSCRKFKGAIYGIDRLSKQIKDITCDNTKTAYIAKLDLKGCFVSIKKDNLYNYIVFFLKKCYECFNKLGIWDDEYTDERIQYDAWLLYKIVYNKPQVGCCFKTPKRAWEAIPDYKSLLKTPLEANQGMPVGNITSQIFVNAFLNILDMFIRFALRYDGENGGYGRYVDDFFLIDTDKEHLLYNIGVIIRFIRRHLGMTISKDKIFLQKLPHSVNFTGSYVTPYHRSTLPRNNYKFRRFLHSVTKAFRSGFNPLYEELYYVLQCANSRLGHLYHRDSFKFRKKLLNNFIKRNPELWSGFFKIYESKEISYNKLLLHPFLTEQCNKLILT